jgi:hypothetical protein
MLGAQTNDSLTFRGTPPLFLALLKACATVLVTTQFLRQSAQNHRAPKTMERLS